MRFPFNLVIGVLSTRFFAVDAFSPSDRPEDGSDLHLFVTRPELRSPRLTVNVHEPDLVNPGYYFVSPYSELKERTASGLYEPHQTGPHIYDQRGNLVWSGAKFSRHGRAVFDFKVSLLHGVPHLSMLLVSHRRADPYPAGAGLILDRSLNVTHVVQTMIGSGIENMHEFNVIEDGRHALMITHQAHYRQYDNKEGFVEFGPLRPIGNPGFVELDIGTGKPVFEWWAVDKILPTETISILPSGLEKDWDWLHLNSVDKNEDGDYLISARYANTIYKISAIDGSILWRLGGKNSSFSLQGFNFSGQHDARFVQLDHSKECVSFLNNAASDISAPTSATTSAMMVCLDTDTMTADLVHEYKRPDGSISELRGNVQTLPSSDILVSWSDNGYMSEFTKDGRHILDLQFTSHRLTTYRGYKFDISLQPDDKPILKALVVGHNSSTSTTVFYVSWNGATEVASWRFFASHSAGESSVLLDDIPWAGFETRYMSSGSFTEGFVQAVDRNGEILGESEVEAFDLPPEWSQEEENAAIGGQEAEAIYSKQIPSVPIPQTRTVWAKTVFTYHSSSRKWTSWASGLFLVLVCMAAFLRVRKGSRRRGQKASAAHYVYLA